MPRRDDLETILLIGSGPIVIGQACEFDYSGTQACRVLREEGYRVILANSNPATIMTDPDFADATYVEPLDVEILTKIIEKERPDALLPTLGGQTALGLPIVIRPAYSLGGKGTGIAATLEEFEKVASEGLDASPITEILIEKSIAGWKEYELEVMRDQADNCVIICSIENVDPMGVHTGDSITVAPAQTLSDVEYQLMRDAAFACIRRVGVETGGSNVQFALNPATGEQIVI